MFTYLSTGSFGEYFLFYRLTEFYISIMLWLEGMGWYSCPRFFPLSSPGVLARDSHPLTATSSSKLIFFTFISADRRRGLFPLLDSSQSFSFYLLLPLSGDSLGLLFVPIPHSLRIRSQSANICWFPFWPGFVTSGLTYITIPLLMVILRRPANSNTEG